MMSARRLRSSTASLFRASRRPLPAIGKSVGHLTNNSAITATASGWRGHTALLHHHYQTIPSRFLHATPLILSNNDSNASSPFSRLSKSNNSGTTSHNVTSGGSRPKKPNNHMNATPPISQAFDEDNNNDASYDDYTTDAYNFQKDEEISQMQLWHETNESKFEQLDAETTQLLDSGGNIGTDTIMSQLHQWNQFVSGITTDMNFDFRTKHPYYPPSEFMTSITYNAAERATSLLMYLTQQQQQKGKKIPPFLEVQAYKLVMNAWSNVFHWSSGDRCEEILEAYGQKFGGDMNYMPSIDDYKTVMKAHLKSCSSRYTTDTVREDEDSTTAAAAAVTSPGEKALEILNLLNNVYTAGDLFLKPDVELFSHTIAVVRNTLLDWQGRRRFHESDVIFEAELGLELLSVLEQMEGTLAEEATVGENDATIQSFQYIVRAYSDAIAVVSRIPFGDEESTSMRSSEQILETLEEIISSNDDAVLQSAGGEDKAIFEEIQRYIEQAYASQLSSRLSVSDFNTALANATTSEQIFNRMKERSDGVATNKSKLFPAPTPDHAQALMRAYLECLRGQFFRPECNLTLGGLEELPHLKAQRLLKELELQQAGRPIDGSLYSDIAFACNLIPHWPAIHKGDRHKVAINSAKALLKHTMNQYSQGSIVFSSVGTSTKIYNTLFSLYFQMVRNSRNVKGKKAAVKQCLELFNDMESWYKESDGTIAKPDRHTLGLILKTLSSSELPSSLDCAQSILQRMADLGVKAKQRDYLLLMRMANDPTKTEEILNRVKANYDSDQSEKPSTSLYTECISAYAKSRQQNSPSKVMQLFNELDGLYESTGDPDFRPDSELIGATINAITKSKSKGPAAIHQAIKLLDRMEDAFDSGLIDVGPNRYAYTSILSAISQTKAPNGHELAEDLLRTMNNRSLRVNDKDILPDTVAYTALLQALARSRSPDKIDKAKKWFEEMENRYAEGNSDMKPNKITYTALINCWRSSGRPDSGEQAQKVLELVERRYQEGDHEIKPDAMMYSSVIDAWSRGRSTKKVERAWDLYLRMKEQYANGNLDMQPNDIIMSTLIKCCGFAQGDEKAKQKGLKVLLQCFSEVTSKKNIGQSPPVYYALLTSLSRLVGDDARRRPIAASMFEACVKAGQMNGSVLNALSECQPELYVKLPFVVNGKYRNEDIPSEWRKNLPQDNRQNRQARTR